MQLCQIHFLVLLKFKTMWSDLATAWGQKLLLCSAWGHLEWHGEPSSQGSTESRACPLSKWRELHRLQDCTVACVHKDTRCKDILDVRTLPSGTLHSACGGPSQWGQFDVRTISFGDQSSHDKERVHWFNLAWKPVPCSMIHSAFFRKHNTRHWGCECALFFISVQHDHTFSSVLTWLHRCHDNITMWHMQLGLQMSFD